MRIMSLKVHANLEVCSAPPLQQSLGSNSLRLKFTQLADNPISFVLTKHMPKSYFQQLSYAAYEGYYWKPLSITTATEEELTVLVNIQSLVTRLGYYGIKEQSVLEYWEKGDLAPLIQQAKEFISNSLGNVLALDDFDDLSKLTKSKVVLSGSGMIDLQFINDTSIDIEIGPKVLGAVDLPAASDVIAKLESEVSEEVQSIIQSLKNGVEKRYQLTEEEYKKIAIFLVTYKETFVEYAKRSDPTGEKGIIIKQNQYGLARSLLITPEGKIFILFNRKFSAKDQEFGQGQYKLITYAYEVNDGDFYASGSSRRKRDVPTADFLEREVHLTRQLKNIPGILAIEAFTIYECKNGKKKCRIVTKLCEGGDLQAFSFQKKLSSSELKTFTVRLATSVHELHKIDCVHRDIKPANIFIFFDSGINENLPILADFGLASKIKRILAHEGSPLYFSPEYLKLAVEGEIVDGEKILKAQDVWSLGLTFYQLYIGSLPPSHQTRSVVDFQNNIDALEGSVLQEPEGVCSPFTLISQMLRVDLDERITMEEVVAMLPRVEWSITSDLLPINRST